LFDVDDDDDDDDVDEHDDEHDDECARSTSRIDEAAGLRPLPLTAETTDVDASYQRANMSPPSPVLHGSRTDSAAATATLASAAFPPRPRRTCNPIDVARGWDVATHPRVQ
jgi:hypothetical protein